MKNFNVAQSLTEKSTNSSGLAMERYAIQMESVEAKANQLKASFESLYLSTIHSDFVKWLLDVGVALVKVVEGIGVLNIALGALSTILVLKAIPFVTSLVSGFQFLGVAFRNFLLGAKAVETAMLATGAATTVAAGAASALTAVYTLGLSLAITAVITGVSKLISRHKEQKKSQEDLIASTKNLTKAQYEYDKSKNTQTSGDYSQAIKDRIAFLEKEIELSKNKSTRPEYKNGTIVENPEIQRIKLLKEEIALLREKDSLLNQHNRNLEILGLTEEEAAALREENQVVQGKSIETRRKEIWSERLYVEALKEEGFTQEQVAEKLAERLETDEDILASTKGQTEAVEESEKAYADASDRYESAISSTVSSLDELYSAHQKAAEGESFSNSEITSLMLKYPQYSSLLSQLNDKYADKKAIIKQVFDSERDLQLKSISNLRTLIAQQLAEYLKLKLGIEDIFGDIRSERLFERKYNDLIGKYSGVTDPLDKATVDNWGGTEGSSSKGSLSDILKKEDILVDKIEEVEHASKSLSETDYEGKRKNLDLQEQQTRSLLDYLLSMRSVANSKGFELEMNDKIRSVESDLISIGQDRKGIEEDIADAKQEQVERDRELRDAQREHTDKLKDSLKEQLELQKESISEFYDAARDAIQEKIDAQETEINNLEKQNALQEEMEERAKRLLAIAEEKERLDNILKERNTKILTGSGWSWIANPKDVRDSQEKIKDLETDLSDWENDLAKKKSLDALRDEIEVWEIEQEELSKKQKAQEKIIDESLKAIELIESDSYTKRLEGVQAFVDAYNGVIARMNSQFGTNLGTIGASSGEMSQDSKDIIADAKAEWATAKAKNDTAGMAAAHAKAETERAKYGIKTDSSGSNPTLLRDSGGILPTGRTAINLSGKSELVANGSQVNGLFNFIRGLSTPSGVQQNLQKVGYGSGTTIQIENLTVRANNEDEFITAMRNFTILTKH